MVWTTARLKHALSRVLWIPLAITVVFQLIFVLLFFAPLPERSSYYREVCAAEMFFALHYYQYEEWVPGTTKDLEQWISKQVSKDPNGPMAAFVRATESSAIVNVEGAAIKLVDPYGRPMIYEYPARDHRYRYRLYSVGENGVDEGGAGDDIDVGFPATVERRHDDDSRWLLPRGWM